MKVIHDRMAAPQNLTMFAGHHRSASQFTQTDVLSWAYFSFNTLLCIGNIRLDCNKDMTDMSLHVLPQVYCMFNVDETWVFAQFPVRVVGDPPLPMIGINHFPGRKHRNDSWD